MTDQRSCQHFAYIAEWDIVRERGYMTKEYFPSFPPFGVRRTDHDLRVRTMAKGLSQEET